jgi:hypothetical protein
MMYLVIFANDNADGVNTRYLTKEQMEEQLAEWAEEGSKMQFSTTVYDFEYWPSYTAVIMKGELVVPSAVAQVTKWEVP